MTRPLWGAAPRLTRFALVLLAGAAFVVATSGPANARMDFSSRADSAPEIWGVEVNGKSVGLLDDKIARRARAAGLNAVLINDATLNTRKWKRVTALVKQYHFKPIFLAGGVNTPRRAESVCTRAKQRDPAKLCALLARTLRGASQLAAAPSLDMVIVRMRKLQDLKLVRSTGTQARVLALVELGREKRIDTKAWRRAIVRASKDPSYDMAVSLVGPNRDSALTSYVSLLGSADVSPPTAPSGLTLVDATERSLKFSWTDSQDDHAVTEYGVYRSDVLVKSVEGPSVTLDGLSCGTTYLINVDAADAAGNRSGKTVLSAATDPCPPPTGTPEDAQAPSTPGGFTATGSTATTVSVFWSPSSDNFAVKGYGMYIGPSPVGETPATTTTFTGLVCGKQYALSVDAYDAAGNRSARASVTAWTSACPEPDTTPPSMPTGLAATVTTTTITLSWNAAGDNLAVVGYGVYLGGAHIGSAGGQSFSFTGLACGKSYSIGVDAYDASSNRSGVASVDATTGACPIADTSAPSSPSAFEAAGTTETSVDLSWNASADNVGVAGYTVYLDAATVANTTSTSVSVHGLPCGKKHTFSIDAYDGAGNRSSKTQMAADTKPCPARDTSPPSVPTSLAAGTVTQNSITLTWGASTDNVGVAGYGVYNGASHLGNTSSTTFTVSGLSCGSSYTLSVDAYDAAGNRSAKAQLNVPTAACPAADTTPPTAPTALVASGATQTTLTLSWGPSSDNVAVTGYGRYRDGSLLSNGTSRSFTFSDLTCGKAYTLAVDAYDAAGNRSSKASLTAATAACPDTQAPSVPSALGASDASQNSITLSWSASSDNVGVTGYGRYRNNSLVSSGTGTSFTFTGLACGTSYTLGVDAYDAAGNRSSKGQLTASTSACPLADTQPPSVPQGRQITATTQTAITMVWLASTDNVGVAGYRVYLNNSLVTSTQQLSYTYTGLTCGTTYTVGVEAYDAAGNASNRTLAQGPAATAACPPDTQAPTPPSALASTGATQRLRRPTPSTAWHAVPPTAWRSMPTTRLGTGRARHRSALPRAPARHRHRLLALGRICGWT